MPCLVTRSCGYLVVGCMVNCRTFWIGVVILGDGVVLFFLRMSRALSVIGQINVREGVALLKGV